MDPLIQRKITRLKVLGISCVVGLWALAMIAFLGYLPKQVFWSATIAEVLLAPFVIGRIRSLRNRRNNAPSNQRL
jgi:hypothetical protein